ncbi:macro domain-containing protein [Actinoplanes sp. NPDC051494]|uniref:macro domain-containing protein n=1 Tax=Actinoplanes sp. NPDC051494 TaxID=3363907 RepID=UPI0037A1FE64
MDLAAYRGLIDLDRPFHHAAPPGSPAPDPGAVLELLAGDPAMARLGVTPGQARRVAGAGRGPARDLLRAMLTVRDPGPLPGAVVPLLDGLLAAERAGRPEVDAAALPGVGGGRPSAMALWRGDITTLRVDAIVNAANSGLLGCFRPGHPCIDNAIHSAAGPRLRDDCRAVVAAQGSPEPTGTAKITRGYHLPARYVLHTVGPVVDGEPGAGHEAALVSAYTSCLDLAAEVDDVRSVALCAVSTGVFGYPGLPAARTAVRTVTGWLAAHPGRLDRVVFDVWSADDRRFYQQALSEGPR